MLARPRGRRGERGERHNHRADYCLARTLAAIAVLGAHPEGLRVVELAAEIGVSRATAYRDVAVMRRAGVPLERVARPGDVARWRLTTK
ncbi:MAG: hypothetical protein Rubg2KO_40990 [Rubricoccaceae bacterium]